MPSRVLVTEAVIHLPFVHLPLDFWYTCPFSFFLFLSDMLHMVADQVTADMVADMQAGMVVDKVAGMVVDMAADKKIVLVWHVVAHGGRPGGWHGRRHGGWHGG